jgi:hypothetical protein
MPTLYGSWQGTSYQARIYCVYSVTYTADRTQAIYAISFGVEFGGSISDSVNTWAVSGDCGSASGSNIAYSIPSGGGTKIFRSGESAQKYGDAVVSASIDNVEAVGGGVISGTFTLDSGALAPYFTNTNYSVRNVTTTGFTTTGIAGNGNGGTLNGVQLEVNTSASDTGALYFTTASWVDATATGLTPGRTYYYRIRIRNSTYGYSAWGPWKTMTTASTIPDAPSSGWYFSNAGQTDLAIAGIAEGAFNGGAAVDQILVRYSTDPAFATYTDIPLAAGTTSVNITNLNPGTTYYVRIFAHNANGYSAPTPDKSATTLPGVMVNVGGVWKVALPYVNVGGIWKPATRFVNVGGVWKQ